MRTQRIDASAREKFKKNKRSLDQKRSGTSGNFMMLKRLLISGAAAMCLVGNAQAQLGQNLFIGNAKALALGNAVTADPPGIDSIHFNPAGLVRLKGTKQHLKLIVGNADISAKFIADDDYIQRNEDNGLEDPTANTTSEIESFAVYLPTMGVTEIPVIAAPLGGLSYNPPGSDITFATAAYAPLILGYTRDDDDPGIYYGRELGPCSNHLPFAHHRLANQRHPFSRCGDCLFLHGRWA